MSQSDLTGHAIHQWSVNWLSPAVESEIRSWVGHRQTHDVEKWPEMSEQETEPRFPTQSHKHERTRPRASPFSSHSASFHPFCASWWIVRALCHVVVGLRRGVQALNIDVHTIKRLSSLSKQCPLSRIMGAEEKSCCLHASISERLVDPIITRNPGSLFSIPGSGIEETVIRDPARILDCEKCINVRRKKVSVFITEPPPQSPRGEWK